ALLLLVAGIGLWLITRPADGAVREIDNRELARLIDDGVMVVDIREPWEWEQTGVIEGSHLITAFDPQGRLEPEFLPSFASLVGPEDEVVLICRTGNRTSFLALALSEQLGYERIRNVTHGILPWIQSGGPVVACRVDGGVPVC
ncbi:MAG: rhodanese-like domain-containing protein, partial [Gemmatimonadales bacterium]